MKITEYGISCSVTTINHEFQSPNEWLLNGCLRIDKILTVPKYEAEAENGSVFFAIVDNVPGSLVSVSIGTLLQNRFTQRKGWTEIFQLRKSLALGKGFSFGSLLSRVD